VFKFPDVGYMFLKSLTRGLCIVITLFLAACSATSAQNTRPLSTSTPVGPTATPSPSILGHWDCPVAAQLNLVASDNSDPASGVGTWSSLFGAKKIQWTYNGKYVQFFEQGDPNQIGGSKFYYFTIYWKSPVDFDLDDLTNNIHLTCRR